MAKSSLVVKECRSVMIIPSMKISHHMVHDKQIESEKLRQACRKLTSTKLEDNISSKSRFEVQGKPKFKKRFSNEDTTNNSNTNKENVPMFSPHGGSGGESYIKRPTCTKYGKKHEGKCHLGIGVRHGCERVGIN